MKKITDNTVINNKEKDKMTSKETFDCLIIGTGIGGLSALNSLLARGIKTIAVGEGGVGGVISGTGGQQTHLTHGWMHRGYFPALFGISPLAKDMWDGSSMFCDKGNYPLVQLDAVKLQDVTYSEWHERGMFNRVIYRAPVEMFYDKVKPCLTDLKMPYRVIRREMLDMKGVTDHQGQKYMDPVETILYETEEKIVNPHAILQKLYAAAGGSRSVKTNYRISKMSLVQDFNEDTSGGSSNDPVWHCSTNEDGDHGIFAKYVLIAAGKGNLDLVEQMQKAVRLYSSPTSGLSRQSTGQNPAILKTSEWIGAAGKGNIVNPPTEQMQKAETFELTLVQHDFETIAPDTTTTNSNDGNMVISKPKTNDKKKKKILPFSFFKSSKKRSQAAAIYKKKKYLLFTKDLLEVQYTRRLPIICVKGPASILGTSSYICVQPPYAPIMIAAHPSTPENIKKFKKEEPIPVGGDDCEVVLLCTPYPGAPSSDKPNFFQWQKNEIKPPVNPGQQQQQQSKNDDEDEDSKGVDYSDGLFSSSPRDQNNTASSSAEEINEDLQRARDMMKDGLISLQAWNTKLREPSVLAKIQVSFYIGTKQDMGWDKTPFQPSFQQFSMLKTKDLLNEETLGGVETNRKYNTNHPTVGGVLNVQFLHLPNKIIPEVVNKVEEALAERQHSFNRSKDASSSEKDMVNNHKKKGGAKEEEGDQSQQDIIDSPPYVCKEVDKKEVIARGPPPLEWLTWDDFMSKCIRPGNDLKAPYYATSNRSFNFDTDNHDFGMNPAAAASILKKMTQCFM